jgi:ribosomal protein S18 acetylase RimI-like enzyme
VAEAFQNRGIGTVLLARALRSMAGQGTHNAWVLWTGDQAARLYARFGFRESRRFAVLHKDLGQTGGPLTPATRRSVTRCRTARPSRP